MRRRLVPALLAAALGSCSSPGGDIARPPAGTRSAHAPAPGEPMPGLSSAEHSRFVDGRVWFEWFFIPDEGLGPVFNAPSCLACHSQPASGGAHPGIHETLFRTATTLPFPVPLGDQAEGAPQLSTLSVAQEFHVPGCDVSAEQLPDSTVGVTIRVTPHLFGAGLIEAIPDQVLIDNAIATARANPELSGRPALTSGELSAQASTRPEISASSNQIARFGARGIVANLEEFTRHALFNEMGMTTAHPRFASDPKPNGMPAPVACKRQPDPEVDPLEVNKITDFVRFLAPPPRSGRDGTEAGEALFAELGCAGCHTPVLRTGDSPVEAFAHRDVPLYSDLLLHDMGPELADPVTQGSASESEWRTTPLWGLGLGAKPLMHDGRAGRDLVEAIRLHGGEATGSRERYFALPAAEQAAVITFLSSL